MVASSKEEAIWDLSFECVSNACLQFFDSTKSKHLHLAHIVVAIFHNTKYTPCE